MQRISSRTKIGNTERAGNLTPSKKDTFVGSLSDKSGASKLPKPPQSHLKSAFQEYRVYTKGKDFLLEQRKFQVHIERFSKNNPQLQKLSSELNERRQAVFASFESMEEHKNAGSRESYGSRLADYVFGRRGKSLLERLQQLKESLEEYEKVCQKSTLLVFNQKELDMVKGMIGRVQIEAQSAEKLPHQQELRRPSNQTEYERRVAELRGLMKSEGKTNEFSTKLSELEAFDKELRKEYGIWDPYPSEGVAKKVYDRATNWGLLTSSSRPTTNQLLIEFSLARAKVEEPTTTSIYSEAVRNFDTQKMLRSLSDLVLQHPTFAAEVAGEISHMLSLLSGNPSAGATLLTALYRKQRENTVFDLLNGSKERSFQKECENPLTREQIALMDFLKRMVPVIGVTQGALGASLGGKAGYAVAGPIGGAVVGWAEVQAQRVLAESMSREVEVWASSLSYLAMTTDWVQTYRSINSLLDGFSIQEGIKLAANLSRPLGRKRHERSMHRGAGNVLKNFREQGLGYAVQESARSNFSQSTGKEIQTPVTQAAFFSLNVAKFLDAINVLPESAWNRVPGAVSLRFLLDNAVLMDTTSETLLGLLGRYVPMDNLKAKKEAFVYQTFTVTREKLKQLVKSKGNPGTQAEKLMEIFKEAALEALAKLEKNNED